MIDFDLVTFSNRLTLSRLLTEVENDTDLGRQGLERLFSRSGRAHLVGITGAPGTGKSSLVTCITRDIRQRFDKTVAIVAVDPSSPFTGGAILGDRVRMRDLAGDNGVFIRSMAARGELGGLARATAGMVEILDAAGFDFVMIETVGAGQSEVDIARLAHTTVVVNSPGMGDDIQAIKAGILEIADILVINKADHPGSDITERALRANVDLGYSIAANHKPRHLTVLEEVKKPGNGWVPPILKTIATQNAGIGEVTDAIFNHRVFLEDTGLLAVRDEDRLRSEVEHQLQTTLVKKWKAGIPAERLENTLKDVFTRKISPGAAIATLMAENKYN